MKKILFVLSLFSVLLITSCDSSRYDTEQISKSIRNLNKFQKEFREGFDDAMRQQVIVINVEGDTIANYAVDSVKNNYEIEVMLDKVDEQLVQLQNHQARLADRQKSELILAIVAITAPCLVIVLIIISVVVYLIKRHNSRNRIIEQAIANDYTLPDSFYTGTPSTHIHYNYVVEEGKNKDEKISDKGKADETFPPVPPVPPPPSSAKFVGISGMDRSAFSKALTLAGIGILLFLFFVGVNATPVGILAGGIPFLIGAGRIITYFYFKDK